MSSLSSTILGDRLAAIADADLTRQERRDLIQAIEQDYRPLKIRDLLLLSSLRALLRMNTWQRTAFMRAYGPAGPATRPEPGYEDPFE